MTKPDPAIETIKRIADQSPFGGLVICRFCHRETGPGNCQHCGKPVVLPTVTPAHVDMGQQKTYNM